MVKVERFASNKKGISWDSFISNIQVARESNGTVSLRFETADKYVSINAGISSGDRQFIHLKPNLYNEDGAYIDEGSDDYFNHPNYWWIELSVDVVGNISFLEQIIALKHEYVVALIPLGLVLTENFNRAIVIDETERNC